MIGIAEHTHRTREGLARTCLVSLVVAQPTDGDQGLGQVTVIAHALRDSKMITALGHQEAGDVRRGGHVRPASLVLRVGFVLLRGLLGEQTAIAAWTRTWQCRWIADVRVSGGSVLGPFETRMEAIQAEESWLSEQCLTGGTP